MFLQQVLLIVCSNIIYQHHAFNCAQLFLRLNLTLITYLFQVGWRAFSARLRTPPWPVTSRTWPTCCRFPMWRPGGTTTSRGRTFHSTSTLTHRSSEKPTQILSSMHYCLLTCHIAQSIIDVKLWKLRFWPFLENGLFWTVPKIPHTRAYCDHRVSYGRLWPRSFLLS